MTGEPVYMRNFSRLGYSRLRVWLLVTTIPLAAGTPQSNKLGFSGLRLEERVSPANRQ